VRTFGICTTVAPVASPVATQTPVASPVATRTPVASPVATQTPVASPVGTQTPVASPVATQTPVASPVATKCQDSSVRVVVNNRPRSCLWVSRKKVQKRCDKPGVLESCPVTCGEICTPFDTEGDFVMKNDRTRDCAFVVKKIEKRCAKNIFRCNCPVTCTGYSYD